MDDKYAAAPNMEKKLAEWPVPKLLMNMSVPMILAMLLNGLYYLVDAIFVGWGVGSAALGGLAVIFPIQMLAVAIGGMLANGTASIVSMELGNQKKYEAAKAVKSAVLLSCIFSIVLLVVLLVFKKGILYALGANELMYPHADGYYRWIVWGCLFVFLSFVEVNIIKAEGNARLAAIGMFTGALLNTLLDPLFIFVFHMGTAGAAIATVVARTISTIYMATYYWRGKSVVDLKACGWVLEGKMIKRILSLGAGMFLNMLSFSILGAIMNISLHHYGSPMDLSIYSVLGRIYIFVTMPLIGLAQGFQAIIAYNFGANKYDRVLQAVRWGTLFSLIIGIVLFVFMVITPRWILHIFTQDPYIINGGVQPLSVMMMLTPLIGIQIISYFFFMALGKPLETVFLSLTRQFIFLVPFLLILPLFLQGEGLWVAYPVADAISVITAVVFIIKENRRNLRELMIANRR